MMKRNPEQESQILQAVETAIRLGVIFLLSMWVFGIVRPFVSPILWGIIIAVAVYPVYVKLARLCGGRTTLAATLFSLIALVLLIAPTVLLTEAFVGWIEGFVAQVKSGSVSVPRPPAGLAEWPVFGVGLHERLSGYAAELESAFRTPGMQLKSFNEWLLSSAASAGSGLLQFILSLIIAGVVLANAESGSRLVSRLFVRLAPGIGDEFAGLAEQTVRSVATGVIGVALIQAILVGVGVFLMDVPGAPVIVLLCLLMGVVQLPVLIVVLPAIVWAWGATTTGPALIFSIWSVLASLSDNVLKPLLLGRGVKAPMLVIFLGAIGGFIASGIIGLFVGAVVLVLSYDLFRVWLDGPGELDAGEDPSSAEVTGSA
jgi:predicted PurR-regulated permease PerM